MARRWIQGAVKKPGALRRQLGYGKHDGPIPLAVLRRAAKASGKLGARARLALMFRGFGKKRKHRGR